MLVVDHNKLPKIESTLRRKKQQHRLSAATRLYTACTLHYLTAKMNSPKLIADPSQGPPKKRTTIIPTREKRRISRVPKQESMYMLQHSKRVSKYSNTKRARAMYNAEEHVNQNGSVKATRDLKHANSSEEDTEDECMADEIKAAMESDVPLLVTARDGTTITPSEANFKIITMLTDIGDYKPLSAKMVAEWTGINLTHPSNYEYCRMLSQNPGIVWNDGTEGKFTICRRASLGVENEACLRHLFKVMLPEGQVELKGSSLCAMAIHERDLQGTYPTVELSIDTMRAEGNINYWIDETSREKWRIFYNVPPGVRASPSTREMWASVVLPSYAEIRDKLIAKGLRDVKEYQQRHKKF